MSDDKKNGPAQTVANSIEKRPNGAEILDPEDLKDPDLTFDELRVLEIRKYLIQGGDTTVFDMLPINNKQKAQMLISLCLR